MVSSLLGPGAAVAAAGGLWGGTAAPPPRHGPRVRQGFVPISIAQKHVWYRHFMHLEASIKKKNILKSVLKSIIQILLLLCFSDDVWLSHGWIPAGLEHRLQQGPDESWTLLEMCFFCC